MSAARARRKRWPWIAGGILLVLLVPLAILGIPILAHQNKGLPNQEPAVEQWPLAATGRGDDGRTRVVSVAGATSAPIDTSALSVGEQLVVTGRGYDGARGIYVAICVIPAAPTVKPGPCIGGVPDQKPQPVATGTVQYAASNWINDDWAWKLFGARSYDNRAAGTFTAYLEVGDPQGSGFDCRVERCAIFTRNDHTALTDRVQDLYLPVGFAR